MVTASQRPTFGSPSWTRFETLARKATRHVGFEPPVPSVAELGPLVQLAGGPEDVRRDPHGEGRAPSCQSGKASFNAPYRTHRGRATPPPPIRLQDHSHLRKRCERLVPSLPKPLRPRRPGNPVTPRIGRAGKHREHPDQPAPAEVPTKPAIEKTRHPGELTTLAHPVRKLRQLFSAIQLPLLQLLTTPRHLLPAARRLLAGYNVSSGGLRESEVFPRGK
jgi:hypothetical protein